MKKSIMILMALSNIALSQTVTVGNRLAISHGDLVLYPSNDTLPMASRHAIKFSKFKLDSDREDHWFQEKYKKVSKAPYKGTGYDLGHLTPAHITSYDDSLNFNSFSLYNQAPQLARFNRGNWKRLEAAVEDSILKYKKDAVVITGVIYDTFPKYLGDSKIKIPSCYFKCVFVGSYKWCWIGSNDSSGEIRTITLQDLNAIFEKKKSGLKIR
jgi:DNA/RNA endonuclease G (NUC1)